MKCSALLLRLKHLRIYFCVPLTYIWRHRPPQVMLVTRCWRHKGIPSSTRPSPDWCFNGSNDAVTSQGVEMVRVDMRVMQAPKDLAWGYVPAQGEEKRVQNISCCFCIDRPCRCLNFIERGWSGVVLDIRGVYLGFLNVYEVSQEERRGRKWGPWGRPKYIPSPSQTFAEKVQMWEG